MPEDKYMFEADENWNDAIPQEIPEFTYWPFVLAVGLMFVGWGVITGYPLFALGLVIFIIGLAGWIYELRETFYEENNNENES
jgi:hypothetical protein